jgi:hypothetical protein
MKKCFKILFITAGMLFSGNSRGQEVLMQKDVDTLYIKALNQRLDWALSSEYKYINLEDQSSALQKMFHLTPLKLLREEELIEISRKLKREIIVHTLDYKIISKDTVDVNFGQYKLKGLRQKGKNSPLAEITECNCGLKAYDPDIRFLFRDEHWTILKSKF